jgi:hypothetical protein
MASSFSIQPTYSGIVLSLISCMSLSGKFNWSSPFFLEAFFASSAAEPPWVASVLLVVGPVLSSVSSSWCSRRLCLSAFAFSSTIYEKEQQSIINQPPDQATYTFARCYGHHCSATLQCFHLPFSSMSTTYQDVKCNAGKSDSVDSVRVE